MASAPVRPPSFASCVVEVTKAKFGLSAKIADTVVAAPSVTEQVSVPAQSAPDQPTKIESLLRGRLVAAAVRTTVWPASYGCEHVAPQFTPDGRDVTIPNP